MSDDNTENLDSASDSAYVTGPKDVPLEQTLVFQCAQCNIIIGDSLSWSGANEILRTICLKSVSKKVRVMDRLVTSINGTDIGSTYNTLQCEVCSEEIGRLYKTTSPQLDYMRGLYTLYLEKLTSYQIGSCDQDTGDVSEVLAVCDYKKLSSELGKLQAVVVGLDMRVSVLEQSSPEEKEGASTVIQYDNKTGEHVEDISDETENHYPQNPQSHQRYHQQYRDGKPPDVKYQQYRSDKQPDAKFQKLSNNSDGKQSDFNYQKQFVSSVNEQPVTSRSKMDRHRSHDKIAGQKCVVSSSRSPGEMLKRKRLV